MTEHDTGPETWTAEERERWYLENPYERPPAGWAHPPVSAPGTNPALLPPRPEPPLPTMPQIRIWLTHHGWKRSAVGTAIGTLWWPPDGTPSDGPADVPTADATPQVIRSVLRRVAYRLQRDEAELTAKILAWRPL